MIIILPLLIGFTFFLNRAYYEIGYDTITLTRL